MSERNAPSGEPAHRPTNSRYTVLDSRGFLDVTLGFFQVCNGPRPGGHFLQKESWEAREIVVNSTARAIKRTVAGDGLEGDHQ